MIRFFGKVYPIRKLLFFFGEGLFLFCSMVVVGSFLSPEEVPSVFDPVFLARVLFVDFVCLLSLYYFDLYTFRVGLANSDMFCRLSQALGSASILLGALFFLFPVLLPGRWVFLSGLGLFFGLSIFWRLLYGFIIRKASWPGLCSSSDQGNSSTISSMQCEKIAIAVSVSRVWFWKTRKARSLRAIP